MARGNESAPTDWVTRAADDVVRHAGATASPSPWPPAPAPRGRSTWATCASSSRRTSWPRSCARRGLAVRHLHSWDDYDRFRKVPVGVPSGVGRAHRPPALRGARPLGRVTPPGPSTSRPRCARRSPRWACEMEEIDQTQMYRSGAYRAQILRAVERRDEIEKVLAQHRTKATRWPRPTRRRPRWPTRWRSTRSPAPATWPASRSRRGAAAADATPRPPRPTTTTRTGWPTPAACAATPAPPTSRTRTVASWCGRSTGRCGGPTSGSTSSRPGSTT